MDKSTLQTTTIPKYMKRIILILKNYKYYKRWKRIKAGAKPIDYERGPGYYFTIGLLGYNPKGKIEETKMQSGKVGIYELVDYELYSDPSDMIKKSFWHFIGYKGIKPIKECTFNEFLELYPIIK